MGGVTVVGALAVKAEVARRGDEEGLEEISLRQRVDLSRDVQRSSGDGDRPAKAKQPIEVEGSNLGVVSLKIREVEVIGQRLLGAGEPHRLEKRLAPVLKLDDQLQLGAPLLLADPNDGQALHPRNRLPYGLPVGPIHLLVDHHHRHHRRQYHHRRRQYHHQHIHYKSNNTRNKKNGRQDWLSDTGAIKVKSYKAEEN